MAPSRSMLALTAAATLALSAAASAAPAESSGPRQLLCGATLNGVGGDMGKVLEKRTGVVKGLDCAQACADTAGCSSYQYCGYGSYTDTCLFVTPPAGSPAPPAGSATTAQAAKGECFLGSGHWRQVPTDKPFGGWTVGIACSSIAADPVPVGGGGEEGGGAAGEEAPGAEPVAAVPVLVAAPAAKAAPALAEKAAPAPAPAKKAPAAAAAPAKKPAPAPAGAPAWAAALAATGPIKPMAVPSAVEKAAAVVPPPAPRAELTTASIKA